jgi:hypothetical protein
MNPLPANPLLSIATTTDPKTAQQKIDMDAAAQLELQKALAQIALDEAIQGQQPRGLSNLVGRSDVR